MGREVRMVPQDWEHPKNPDGSHQPLLENDDEYGFAATDAEWQEGNDQWNRGFCENHGEGDKWVLIVGMPECKSYTDYAGNPPHSEDYMPYWPEAERTHYMMYENVSEGTPISPAFETPEQLAQWLVDNNASAMGLSHHATYEQWLAMIYEGSAPSMMYTPGTGVISGVEATTLLKNKDQKDEDEIGGKDAN